MTHGSLRRVKNVAEQWSPAFVGQPATYARGKPIAATAAWDSRLPGLFQPAMHSAGEGGPTP